MGVCLKVLLDARFGDAARLKWFAELSDARQPLAPNLNCSAAFKDPCVLSGVMRDPDGDKVR